MGKVIIGSGNEPTETLESPAWCCGRNTKENTMCKLAWDWHMDNAEQIAVEYGFDMAIAAWKAIETLLPFCSF